MKAEDVLAVVAVTVGFAPIFFAAFDWWFKRRKK